MKNASLFLILVLFIQSCSPSTDNLKEDISKVEKSLITPVYINGDSMWTIEERMKHYGVPGVSIAVIQNSTMIWSKTYGIIDKETNEPVTKNTLFQAGSISKPVAAYGALKAVELGKINLEENVNTYLTSWKLEDNDFTAQKKVTLSQLLSHTGGVTVHGFPGYSPDLAVPTLEQVLNGEKPANTGRILVDKLPGQSFRYSGGGYTIMQQMLINIEGRTFPEILDSWVLKNLDMTNSTYNQPLTGDQLGMAATGYLPDGSQTKGKRHTYPEMAAAGLWTTAEDLAKFAIDIQNTSKGKSSKVLSQETVNRMLTPYVEDFIGLGIFIEKKKEDVYFSHGGWDEGFSSLMIGHRDKGYGVVVLINSNHPEFINELVRSVALTYGWSNYIQQYDRVSMMEETKTKIFGRFLYDNEDVAEIYGEGNRVFLKYLLIDPLELIQVDDSTFVRRERPAPIRFKVNPVDGKLNLVFINENKPIEFLHPKMEPGTKIPFEYLMEGDDDRALVMYKALKKNFPEDNAIQETTINRTGYSLLEKGKTALAAKLFKVNVGLYPQSANVYDSYAEACMKNGDSKLAIENYIKSLKLNPDNDHARDMLKELGAKGY